MIKIVIIEQHKELSELFTKIAPIYKHIDILKTYTDATVGLDHIPFLNPNIVLIGIGIEESATLEHIKALYKTYPFIKFMAYTNSLNEKGIMDAFSSGISSYILKTSSAEYIMNAIVELSKGGNPISSEVNRIVLNRLFQIHHKPIRLCNKITSREMQVLELLTKGYTYKEIAEMMNISINTLKTHCYNIYQKIEVSNKIEAINYYQYNLRETSY